MGIFNTNFESIGIDIGDRSLKLAFIKKHGSSFSLENHGSINVPIGAIEEGIIKKQAELIKCIQKLVSQSLGKKIKTNYAHVCLPETKTFIKRISIEPSEKEEICARIKEELPNHIPIPTEELYLDWKILNKNQEQKATDILVGAVPKDISDSYTNTLLLSGIKPVSLQIEAEAILRSILPVNRELSEAIAIIDIGATRSSFICFDKQIIQFSVTLPISGENITQIIEERLKITRKEAEKAKRLFGIDKHEGDDSLSDIIKTEITELIESIKKNLSYYNEHFQNTSEIKYLAITGGGAYLKGFINLLSEELPTIKIYNANPLINLNKNQKNFLGSKNKPITFDFLNKYLGRENINIPETFLIKDSLRYTTAIGLALTNILK